MRAVQTGNSSFSNMSFYNNKGNEGGGMYLFKVGNTSTWDIKIENSWA